MLAGLAKCEGFREAQDVRVKPRSRFDIIDGNYPMVQTPDTWFLSHGDLHTESSD